MKGNLAIGHVATGHKSSGQNRSRSVRRVMRSVAVLSAAAMLITACGTGEDAGGDETPATGDAPRTAATAPATEDTAPSSDSPQQDGTESVTGTTSSEDTSPAPADTAPQPGGGGTFAFGLVAAPPSLNPGIGDPAYAALYQWAYDSLVILQPDGTYAPNLAVEFGYTDDQNMRYEVTLREGVKFSDGTDLDAEALKTYFEYVRSQPTSLAQLFASVADIEVTGPLSVALVLSAPDPGLTFGLAQGFGGGNVISPAALEAPETLDLGTAGAGPYMLVPDESTPSDTYTFVPNPHYWNPARVHWDEVVIRIIPNSSSIIEAIRAGQLNGAQGDATTMAAAADAGITVIGAPMAIVGINLVDRDGAVSAPLGDVRVRRALNHAVDREAVAAALLGDSRFALRQYALSGQKGHDPALDEANAYNPERARQLLAEAGYADGVTIEVLDASLIGLDILTQAIAGQLGEVGVTLDRTTVADATAYFTGLVSAQYPAVALFYGVSSMQTYRAFFIDPAGPFNPFGTVDPELDALYAEYFSTVGDTSDVERRINARLVDQAWVLPVMGSPLPWYLAEGLTGIEATSANTSLPTLADIRPE